MKRTPALALGLLAALLTSYCGAGAPQNEMVRDAATLSLFPLTTLSDEARELVADGMREWDMKRGEEAYEYFERAIAADPGSGMIHMYAWWSAQSLETGVAHYRKAQELAVRATGVEKTVLELARNWYENNPVGALELARRLAQEEPNNPRSWIELAEAHNSMQAHDSARAAYAKAIAVAPSFTPTYLLASANYATLEPRDLEKAEQLARKALALQPNEAVVHDILGDALRQRGKLEEAAAEYTKTAELDPTRGDGFQQRAHVHTFMGQFAEARADYDAAVAVATGNSKSALGMYRALVHVYEGNPKDAIAEFEKHYSSIDAMNLPEPIGQKIFVSQAAFHIAVVNRMTADTERLAARIDELAAHQTATINTGEAKRGERAAKTLRAGMVAWAKGDYTAAKKRAAEFIEIQAPAKRPGKNRGAHDLLGMVALSEQRYADAVREFEQGSPNNIYMNFQHGLALEAAGRQAEAQKLFQKAATFYWNNEGTALVRNDALKKVNKATS